MQGPVLEAARYLIPVKGEAPESPSGLPSSELPYLYLPIGVLGWLQLKSNLSLLLTF